MRPAPRPARRQPGSAAGTWSLPVTDQAGSRRMMRGYLDTSDSSTTTVTVASLASGSYDVYVYVDGDNAAQARTAGYTISGAGITTTTITLTDPASTNFNATFTQGNNGAGNYVKFTINATGFVLTAVPGTSPGSKRAPVNGIQIVPVGPPIPDFALTATPTSRSVVQGSGTSYTIGVNVLNGFSGSVNLIVSGQPANSSAQLANATVIAGSGTSLDIATSATAPTTPTGAYTLTITGTSGALTRTTTVSLTVTGQTYSVSGTITPRPVAPRPPSASVARPPAARRRTPPVCSPLPGW